MTVIGEEKNQENNFFWVNKQKKNSFKKKSEKGIKSCKAGFARRLFFWVFFMKEIRF